MTETDRKCIPIETGLFYSSFYAGEVKKSSQILSNNN